MNSLVPMKKKEKKKEGGATFNKQELSKTIQQLQSIQMTM